MLNTSLQRLTVQFMVADLVHPQLSMGCRWLRAQSCPELRMHATLGPASCHEADLVMELNGLLLHRVHLEQQPWARPLQEGAAWCSLDPDPCKPGDPHLSAFSP